MVLKIAIPGKMQFKMMRREPYLLHRKGDVHYIGGAEVLPPPLPRASTSERCSPQTASAGGGPHRFRSIPGGAAAKGG